MEEQSQMQAVKRPWQGTTWAWLSIVLSAIGAVGILIITLGVGMMGVGLEDRLAQDGVDVVGLMAGLMGIIVMIAIPFFALLVALSIGFFKGWKWAVIVAIILEGLAVISALFGLGETGGFFNLLLSGFMLYLAIACLQHPFYNRKK